MNYENEILIVLREVGCQGMPLRRIALNVYNIVNTLFSSLSQEEVYNDVADYLRVKSSQLGAPVEKAEVRGWYRLNMDSARVQQLFIEFIPDEEDDWMR